MDITTALALMVLFLIGLYVENRRGFREGVHGGHMVGVAETIEFLDKRGKITALKMDNGVETPVKTAELIGYIYHEIEKERTMRLASEKNID